jgi:hypothetical protein
MRAVGSEKNLRRFFRDPPKLASQETRSRAAVDNRRNFNVLKARS